MTFLELVNTRYSCRSYQHDKPVDRTVLDRCVEAARLAPSACNSQPWKFYVVDDPAAKSAVAIKTLGPLGALNAFAPQAPVMVVITAERPTLTAQIGGFLKNRPFYLMDIGIAAEHFCLQAAQEGLGTCMIGWFDEPGVRKALRISGGSRIALVITVGYPAPQEPRIKKRKSVDDMRLYV